MTEGCWRWTEGKNNTVREKLPGKAFPYSVHTQIGKVTQCHPYMSDLCSHILSGWSSTVSSPSTLQSSGDDEAPLCVNFSFVDGPNVPSSLSIQTGNSGFGEEPKV